MFLHVRSEVHEHADRVDADACGEPRQWHLKASATDDVGRSPIQCQAGPDEDPVPKRGRFLPILIPKNVGFEDPQQTVRSVKGRVHPCRRVVPLFKVMHESKARKNRCTFVTVDEMLLFHGCTNKRFGACLPWNLENVVGQAGGWGRQKPEKRQI